MGVLFMIDPTPTRIMKRKETAKELPIRPDVKLDLRMPSWQRRKLLREWANNINVKDGDVIARVALDEIEELDIKLLRMDSDLVKLKEKRGV